MADSTDPRRRTSPCLTTTPPTVYSHTRDAAMLFAHAHRRPATTCSSAPLIVTISGSGRAPLPTSTSRAVGRREHHLTLVARNTASTAGNYTDLLANGGRTQGLRVHRPRLPDRGSSPTRSRRSTPSRFATSTASRFASLMSRAARHARGVVLHRDRRTEDRDDPVPGEPPPSRPTNTSHRRTQNHLAMTSRNRSAPTPPPSPSNPPHRRTPP